MTLEEVNERTSKLEDELPGMIEKYSVDGDFWAAFAGQADEIVDEAPGFAEFVQGRRNCILGAAGMVPSDTEGDDCAS